MIPAFLCLLAAAAPQATVTAPRYPEFLPERLQAEVRWLADDSLEGRETGSFGAGVAARYVESCFRRFGLEAPEGGYLQPFPAGPLRLDEEVCGLTLQVAGVEEEYEPGSGFLPHPASPPGEAEGEVVFAGYALEVPEYDYDDLYGLDLRGKVVLLFRFEPQAADAASRFLGRRLLPEARLARKVALCQERGAVAVLVADPPGLFPERSGPPGTVFWPGQSTWYNQFVRLVLLQVDPNELARSNFTPEDVASSGFAQLQFSAPLGARIPVAYVSQEVADRILAAAGRDAAAWRREVDETGVGEGFPTRVRARIRVGFEPPEVEGWNVVGLLPGRDGAATREWVVVGAHLDHVGRNAEGIIWNGADDNASGTALLLALARSFVREEEPLRRGLVFVSFFGEEEGLLGAARFLADPPVPLEAMVAMVNLDMVGRSVQRRVEVVGSHSASGLRRLAERAAEGLDLHLDFESEELFHRSDQAPFYFAGIPILFFNTSEHVDYHRPSDTWDKLEYTTLSDIGVLVRRVVGWLGSLDPPPAYEDGYHRLQAVYDAEPELPMKVPIPFADRLDY